MNDMTCFEVEEAATEYALGLLPPGEARSVQAHLIECAACQQEVADIRDIGDQLLELIPDAEPPLGFDRKVLASVSPRRPQRSPMRRLGLLAAAAVVLIAFTGLGTAAFIDHHHGPGQPKPAEMAGTLRQDDHRVGTVEIGGHPTWVYMTVNHLAGGGSVSCQLVSGDGTATTIGSFQLVDGSGSWGAPDTARIAHPISVRIVSSTGAVLATAALHPS